MTEERFPLLVVGLGNPGKSYEYTRHNIGFLVARALAQELGMSFQMKREFHGEYSQGYIGENKVMILLPTTYMNLSGESLKRCMDFFKIPPDRLIVVCDDVALPFSKLRLRDQGSPGGHNGLKNIEMYLGSYQYSRLKVGIGRKEEMDLADYVLAQFDPEELKCLPEVIENAKNTLLVWLKEGYSKAVEYLGVLYRTSLQTPTKAPVEDKKKNIKDD